MDAIIGRIKLRTSADWTHTFRFLDDNKNEPRVFTGTFACDFKTEAGASAALSLTTANGGFTATTAQLADGTFSMKIAHGTLTEGTYQFEVIAINGSDRDVLILGECIVEAGITTP